MGLHPTFPGNPSQKWQWKIQIDGVDAAWFEGCTLPHKTLAKDTFNPAGSVRPTNFAGRAEISEITLHKGVRSESADLQAYNWLTQACNTQTGDLGDPASYKRDLDICRVNRLGVTVEKHECKGCYVQEVSLDDPDGSSSDHMIENIVIVPDDYERTA